MTLTIYVSETGCDILKIGLEFQSVGFDKDMSYILITHTKQQTRDTITTHPDDSIIGLDTTSTSELIPDVSFQEIND